MANVYVNAPVVELKLMARGTPAVNCGYVRDRSFTCAHRDTQHTDKMKREGRQRSYTSALKAVKTQARESNEGEDINLALKVRTGHALSVCSEPSGR